MTAIGDRGLDVAWGEPLSWQHCYDLGYRFVFFYLSNDPSKNLDAEDRDACLSSGLDIGLVWETFANPLVTNPATAGKTASRQAAALGAPAGAAVYFAFDYNVPRTDWDAGDRWLRLASFDYPTGVYGPRLFLDEMLRRGAARYGWQAGGSYLWENGANGDVTTAGHLYQRAARTLPDPGGSTDEDVALKTDCGLWIARPAPAPATPGLADYGRRRYYLPPSVYQGKANG